MDDEEGRYARILAEIEGEEDGYDVFSSDAALSDLQAILDEVDGDSCEIWSHLASRNVPPTSLVKWIATGMESNDLRASLVSSRVYLSALLSASAPVYSLFNPIAFLSLLRSIRRAIKIQHTATESSEETRKGKTSRGKRKGGGANSSGLLDGDRADQELLPGVFKLVEEVLDKVHLNTVPDGTKSLIDTVTEIFGNQSLKQQTLSDSCFRILVSLVSNPQHGNQSQSAAEIMRALSPTVYLPPRTPARSAVLRFFSTQLAELARESEPIRESFIYLPRYLAMMAPDKADSRSSAVDGIIEILKVMESTDRASFIQYATKMSQGKTHLRFLAVDLISSLLTTSPNSVDAEDTDDDGHDDNDESMPWVLTCLGTLLQRCSDVSASIRARALTNLAQAIEFLSKNSKYNSLVQNFITSNYDKLDNLLMKRCLDEKAAVRKASLVLITKYTSLTARPMDETILKTLGRACSDHLVSIRKAAVSALSEAFRKFKDCRVITEWLHSVPPLIADNETSVQEECETLFLDLILNWIASTRDLKINTNTPNLESIYTQALLCMLKVSCDSEVAPYVKKICTSLGKKKKIRPSIAASLQKIITTSESIWKRNEMPMEKWVPPPGAWFMLSEISSFAPSAIEWEFLHHHWELVDRDWSTQSKGDNVELGSVTWAEDRVCLLQIISNVSGQLPSKPAADLAHNLLTRIQTFDMHLAEVEAHVKALTTLCKRKASNDNEGESLVLKWANQVSSNALETLENYIDEVSHIKNASNFHTPLTERKRERLTSSSLSRAVAAVFTVGSISLVCPSADLKCFIPKLLSIIVPDKKKKHLSSLSDTIKEMAPALYNHSWVTMGKLCLVDDKLAKRYIPLFIQELGKTDSPALRNNIMISMADFCVRYTALVDCYIPKITNSLRDPCEIVRRQTFLLLSRLVQRDYVKWKGVLFRRFLLTLVDESEKIRHLADYLFGHIMKVKAPLLAYNSFIEAIFSLNDCRSHSGLCDNELFSLKGNDEKSRTQRMHIYTSLLRQMAPEQLLATSAKLCAEILAAVPDGLLNIDDPAAQSVLQDALRVLSCKEMRLRQVSSHEAPDDIMDSAAAAKGRAVTQASKKNLVQHAVPIFIELKRLLESRNSPLMGALMDCLCVLLKEYKSEMEDILVGDRQLHKELVYEMSRREGRGRGREEEVAREVVRSGRADGAGTPLSTIRLPKVRGSAGVQPTAVLESLRKRQSFQSDDEF